MKRPLNRLVQIFILAGASAMASSAAEANTDVRIGVQIGPPGYYVPYYYPPGYYVPYQYPPGNFAPYYYPPYYYRRYYRYYYGPYHVPYYERYHRY